MNASRIAPFVLLLAALALGACDTSIQKFEETERAYSVFGYLDATADTQFVRIEPLQDSTFIGSESINASVTTTNLETGNTVVWRDSIFDLAPRSDDTMRVHNFYTTADIEPEATYRFRVEGEAGESTAEVTLPERFPPLEVAGVVPSVGEEGGGSNVVVTARHTERLGGVSAFYHYSACNKLDCFRQQRDFYHLADTTRVGMDTYRIAIPWKRDIESTLGPNARFNGFYLFQVKVASVSEDWPDYPEDDPPGGGPQGLLPPGINSNIENGVGFLGGAAVRTVHVPIGAP